MTTTAPHPPTVPPLPPAVYWTLLAVAAGLPVLLTSDAITEPWRVIIAAVNASLAVLTGTSRPGRRGGQG